MDSPQPGAPAPETTPEASPPPGARQQARLLIAALGIAIAFAVAPYATGLIGSAILYVIFEPVHKRLSRSIRPRWSALIVTIVATVLVTVPALWLVSVIIQQAPGTIRAVEQSQALERLSRVEAFGVDLGEQLTRTGGAVASWLSQQLGHALGGATSATLNVMIAMFGLYYLLDAADTLWNEVIVHVPFSRATSELLRTRFHMVTRATLIGMAAVAIAQGSVVGLGFWIVGLSHPLFWGVMTGAASVLPVLGSALIWLPGVIVLLASDRFGAAVALALICGIIASNIDNFIRPMVYRRVSNVHPMTTLVGAFAGVSLFGLIGLLLGPLLISYFFELLHVYRAEYGTGRG